MAAPEFVICPPGDGYKVYPGGIIVLAAVDWMASARAGLSSESDARSCCGQVVRESQVGSSVLTSTGGSNTDCSSANPTLVIPMTDIPVEDDLLRYGIFVSVLYEGTWDPTNGTQSRNSSQEYVDVKAAELAFYGSTSHSALNPTLFFVQPCHIDNYRIIGSGQSNWRKSNISVPWSTYTMTWKGFVAAGSTLEILIDQIYFIPSDFSTGNNWDGDDFAYIDGQVGTYGGLYNLDPTDGDPDWIDGADGGNGDGLGKFTWEPLIFNDPTEASGGDGGGDYQKADNEYYARVVADGDFYYLADSTKTPPYGTGIEEVQAYCYGLHGSHYIPEQRWVEDHFSRTDGDNNFGVYGDPSGHFLLHDWGLTPEGYRWKNGFFGFANPSFGPQDAFDSFIGHRHGASVFTNGSEAAISVCADDTYNVGCILGGDTIGATVDPQNSVVRLTFRVEDTGTGGNIDNLGDPTLLNYVYIGTGLDTAFFFGTYYIFFEALGFEGPIATSGGFTEPRWTLVGPGGPILGPINVESWWGLGVQTGVHLEIRRHRLRAKVWDAGGAEPGAYDYDDYRVFGRSFGGNKAYPYDEDINYSVMTYLKQKPWVVVTGGDHRFYGRLTVYFDNVTVDYDPGGSNESAFASIEQPDGNEVGRIEIPPGCQHLVYWGKRDWTVFLPSDAPYIEFSAKMWNDPGAAELQRADAVWWYFRTVHATAKFASIFWHPYKKELTKRRYGG